MDRTLEKGIDYCPQPVKKTAAVYKNDISGVVLFGPVFALKAPGIGKFVCFRQDCLTILYAFLEAGLQDRGAYLFVKKLETEKSLAVGGKGEIDFKPGFYVYTGSAKRGLKARVARHLQKRKTGAGISITWQRRRIRLFLCRL